MLARDSKNIYYRTKLHASSRLAKISVLAIKNQTEFHASNSFTKLCVQAIGDAWSQMTRSHFHTILIKVGPNFCQNKISNKFENRSR